MTNMLDAGGGGLRERKKRERLQRIAEVGLKLFVKNGYDETTLDEIAVEAGIARRTFFSYFPSKEAILMECLRGGFVKALKPALLQQPTNQTPFAAVRNCLLQIMSFPETEDAIMVDRLFGSTEALRARKQAVFVEVEQAAFDALCELWPEPSRRASLRMVAMAAIGALRVTKENWSQDGGKQPLKKCLEQSFAALEQEI